MNLNALYRSILVIGIIIFGAFSYAQPLQFEPLVEDWMISEEILIGEAIVTEPINEGDNASGVFDVKVTSNGTDYLVVWYGWDDKGETPSIFGVALDLAGKIIPDSQFTIGATLHDPAAPLAIAASSDGNDYLLVWREVLRSESGYRLVASRITLSGLVLDPDGMEIRRQRTPKFIDDDFDVESNGMQYLVSWWERNLNNPVSERSLFKLYGSALQADRNQFLVGNALIIGEGVADPAVSADDDGTFLVATEGRSEEGGGRIIRIVKTTSMGEVLFGLDDTMLDSDPSDVALGFNGSRQYAVWRGIPEGSGELSVLGALLPENINLGISNAQLISLPQFRDSPPSISSDGDGYLVIWEDNRNQVSIDGRMTEEIYGSRISAQGQALDTGGIQLVGGSHFIESVNALSSNGSNYLMAYIDGYSTRDNDDDTIKAKLIINADRYLILSEPSLTEDGQIQFQFNAAPGFNFVIEHSSDFESWSELTRFNDFSGEAIVTDNTAGNSSRFYRARRVE